jgi:arylsulfatase A-like enzyme
MKKIMLGALLISLFCSAVLAQVKPTKLATSKLPNIIYILADDMGYAELGCYGQQKIKTPNIDQIAKEGIRFTNHYASTPVCAPDRCMLLTGKQGGHSYIRGNYELGEFADSLEGGQMPLPEGIFTIPKMLKKSGYTTGAVGKWGLGMTNTTGSPLKQGFDYFYGYLDQKQAHNYYPTHLWENDKWDKLDNPFINVHKHIDSTKITDQDFEYFKGKVYAGDKMTEKALAFIHKNKSKPFFLYFPTTIPHVSLQVPEKYVDLYKGKFNERPYYGQYGYVPTKYPLSTYAGMITFLDDQVGLIVNELKKLGLDDNTIIMFSSDNGTSFNGGVSAKFFNSVAGLRGLKMDVFEGGIREPFIVKWPGTVKAGTTSDFISAQFDMMATFADIIHQQANNTDGISLLPALLGHPEAEKKREYIYFEYPEKGGQLGIRMGDWKGVKINQRHHKENKWMIFNLKQDPFETTDLINQHPELVTKFDAIVQKEHQNSHIRDWEFVNPKFDVKNINE